MSYSRLIHDYLDGELEQSQQDALFNHLAANTDVRSEFNQQVKLHLIAQKDMATISPPVSTTNAIFASLGFTIPPGGYSAGAGGAAVAATKSAGLAHLFWGFLVRYTPNLFTALLTAGITGAVIFFMTKGFVGNQTNNADNHESAKNAVKQTEQIMAANGTTNQVKAPDSKEISRIVSKAINNYFQKYESNYITYMNNLDKAVTDNKSPITEKDESYTDGAMANKIFTAYDNNVLLVKDIKNPEPVITNFIKPFDINANKTAIPGFNNLKSNFSLQLRGFSNVSSQANMPTNSKPWFNDMSASINYNLNENNIIGVEVGQEAFLQQFVINEPNGKKLSWKQNPTRIWYGGLYRFSFTDFLIPKILYPYSQIFAGATPFGPLGRLQAGLQYTPDKRVTFTMGAEYSALIYNVQGNLFATKKFGLTYGVSIYY